MDGLFAAIDADTVEIATGRGSHGSAALHVAEDGNVPSIHPELADVNGKVSEV